jgi:hypothetical protein
VLAAAAGGAEAAAVAAVRQQRLTHASDDLAQYSAVYGALLGELLLSGVRGTPAVSEALRTAVVRAARALPGARFDVEALARRALPDTDVVGGIFSSACYIDGSFRGLLYLAFKYAADPEAALKANTNCGGENCHRGAALGGELHVD